jgi:hypothetical protein
MKIIVTNKFQKLVDSQHEIINNLTETVGNQREDTHVLKQDIDQQNNVIDEKINETKHLNSVIQRIAEIKIYGQFLRSIFGETTDFETDGNRNNFYPMTNRLIINAYEN